MSLHRLAGQRLHVGVCICLCMTGGLKPFKTQVECLEALSQLRWSHEDDLCPDAFHEPGGNSCCGTDGVRRVLHCLHRWMLGEWSRGYSGNVGSCSSCWTLGRSRMLQHVCSALRLHLRGANAIGLVARGNGLRMCAQ